MTDDTTAEGASEAGRGEAGQGEGAAELYLISPERIELQAFGEALDAALGAAADTQTVGAFQLRLKGIADLEIGRAVQALMPICHGHGVSFILNDRPDLAAELECDGVHIGQSDGSYEHARSLMGPERVVGVTCHASRHLAMEAGETGADYVAFGAFFPTRTKETRHHPEPEILEWWSTMMVVPCVAIGGITAKNCAPLVTAGADFLAVVSAVWDHPEGPGAAVAEFRDAMGRAVPPSTS